MLGHASHKNLMMLAFVVTSTTLMSHKIISEFNAASIISRKSFNIAVFVNLSKSKYLESTNQFIAAGFLISLIKYYFRIFQTYSILSFRYLRCMLH